MKGCATWVCLIACWLPGVTVLPLTAQSGGAARKPAELKVVEIKEKDGQILSYRHLAGSTEVVMKGTRLAPEARIKLKVGSRPGFVEIDINRGAITGLKPAYQLGRDFLTYVLWAVSVDGRASNLGEITFAGEKPVSINVTTPYQTFWLMVTAEPSFAVVDPSPRVVIYSVNQSGGAGAKALAIKGDLFFYTHYTGYDSAPGTVGDAPNDILQARKAVELASKSGVLAVERPGAPRGSKDEERARESLKQAKEFLAQAEKAYRINPEGTEDTHFARTAAQIAENARALAQGAVGGVYTNELEKELVGLRSELAKSPGTRVPEEPAEAPAVATPVEPPAVATPVELPAPEPLRRIISNPITWFGLIGWGLALLLLLRRRAA